MEHTYDLDFIISHFQEPVWPRTLSTNATEGRQVLVFNKEDAIQMFKQANFLDCRINAYPDYTGFRDINRQAPNFIFIDLDLSAFNCIEELSTFVKKVLKKIDRIFGVNPTVIWSGNGYHIYLPLEAFPLEQEVLFSKFDQPSKAFLKFAELHLTNCKSDPSHNPSFKSCMIRIPGSFNTKCAVRNNNIADYSTEVKIIQRWDGKRPKFNVLLYEFNIWLVDREVKKIRENVTRLEREAKHKDVVGIFDHNNSIPWIETLLQTGLCDHRKYCIWRILTPYLLKIRGMSSEESFGFIKDWLDKCNELERLNFNPKSKIREGLMGASKGYYPISLEKLKDVDKELYDILIRRVSLD